MSVKQLFCILFILMLGFSAFAQRYANNQFIIYSYSIDIDDRVKQELKVFEAQISYNPINKQNKVDAILIHTMYNLITKAFSDSLKIFFLPPHSLTDKAKFNEYGYPEIIIQKAIRLSDTKYFMKIEASIENSKYDEKGKKITENVFVPVVNVSISIYNKFGFNPIQTSEGQSIASKPIVVSPSFIAGMNFVSSDIETISGEESLKQIMDRAISDALYGIMNKKQK
jgi:hypothetical protein